MTNAEFTIVIMDLALAVGIFTQVRWLVKMWKKWDEEHKEGTYCDKD